jgi:hypothetical protein
VAHDGAFNVAMFHRGSEAAAGSFNLRQFGHRKLLFYLYFFRNSGRKARSIQQTARRTIEKGVLQVVVAAP